MNHPYKELADSLARNVWTFEHDGELCEGIGKERVRTVAIVDCMISLRKLVRIFECQNFTQMPSDLRAIKRNTTKRKRKAASR